jgi:dihydrodipicolinate synthase/N-acetylneuraminate lyase
MKTISAENLRGVFAVPPLARSADAQSIDFSQNEAIVNHIKRGGISRVIYGGNAFLYHVQLREFEAIVEWLETVADDNLWVIPSIGPSYGRALEQARILRTHSFPCTMVLPCADPRDAAGLERGYREIADAAEAQLIVYLKEETNFGSDKEAGLDAVARLIDDKVCAGIKYAVVRADPGRDAYLEALLARVNRAFVISGIGERPAVTHLRAWKLPGFTTGSGCIAPALSQTLFDLCKAGDFEAALGIREHFLPLEDLRDALGPARVLHHATELAGVARTGGIAPYISPLSDEQLAQLEPVAKALAMSDKLQCVSDGKGQK